MKIYLYNYYWKFVSARNGKTIAHSEQYYSRANCRRAAKRYANYLLLPIVDKTKSK